ncbi:AP-2 complex subunit sigma-like isoform X2 [Durio zibethinus]|nr:AP-2 complex subunit sigma-like isoform X2 [Durio zibethinus]XP_022769172.1 AP-2 complex subunit sigma-like isoform X2 [Durio zibethinus]XP_022769173.1 AP-2 complex subunit sigma-like isoform X2 [Durio zibethinus]
MVNRDPKFTNFDEFRTHKVIYRRYAGLFFSLCVDITDNELAYLECIHLFVEILDHFFSSVCELDLVFNIYKVYLILDEFILAGELQETSKKAIRENGGAGETRVKMILHERELCQIFLIVASFWCYFNLFTSFAWKRYSVKNGEPSIVFHLIYG